MKFTIKYIPNLITITRIITSFIFSYTIMNQFVYDVKEKSISLIALFLIICISDLLDGKIARKIKSTSIFGAKLDVFADLLYVILSYGALVNIKILPLWFLGFVCFKFSEFVITSKFIKSNNKSSDNPFVFDKVGRAISVIFFVIPGIACIYRYLEPHNFGLILNYLLFTIFLVGIYSSYTRIKSCLIIYKLNNNRYIN